MWAKYRVWYMYVPVCFDVFKNQNNKDASEMKQKTRISNEYDICVSGSTSVYA